MVGTSSLIRYGGKMSNFLWVEDFGGSTLRDTTVNVFGEMLQNKDIPETKKEVKNLLRKDGVFVELSFLGGLDFIRNPQKLFQVDYIILDIWLDVKIKSDKDENNWLPQILQEYYGYKPQPNDEAISEKSLTEAKKKLLNVAGYQLYVELVMEHGFPKDHILFCSDHADQQKSIEADFKQAKIEFPLLFSKDDKSKVQAWVRERREKPYSVLRRGILNVLDDIEGNANFNLTEPFKKDVPVNKDSFLDGLRFMLSSPRVPSEDKRQQLFRTLCDYLTKYFDKKGKQKPKEYFFPSYLIRNWVAHNILTHSQSELSEPDVAFLFILVMKAMFNYSSIEHFNLLYDYGEVNDNDLQIYLMELHKKHSNDLRQCDVCESIRLKGFKALKDIKNEDFVAHLYASFLFSSVILESKINAPDIAETNNKFGYWVDLTYLIDSQKDSLFKFLKSIAYHRLKDKNYG